MRYSDHIDSQGQAFFEQSCRLSLEGIVCKRASSPYHPGRSKQWVKVKCANYEEFVVGGYTDPGGSRSGIATFVMRGKEYLIAIVAEKGILRAETLRFHDDLRTPSDVGLPDNNDRKADGARVRSFEKSIRALTKGKLDRKVLEDHHSQQLLKRAREKLDQGQDVIEAPQAPEDESEEGGEVVDLMQVLKQSLAQGYSPVTGSPPKRRSSAKGTKGRTPKKGASAKNLPARRASPRHCQPDRSTPRLGR